MSTKAVLDAIADQEIATAKHIEAAVARLDVSKKRLALLSRRVYLARQRDEMTRAEARKAFVAGFVALALAEYAHDIPKVKALTDAHLEKQFEAVKKLDVRLSKVPALRNIDIKARAENA